jgi:hypothetical protein
MAVAARGMSGDLILRQHRTNIFSADFGAKVAREVMPFSCQVLESARGERLLTQDAVLCELQSGLYVLVRHAPQHVVDRSST